MGRAAILIFALVAVAGAAAYPLADRGPGAAGKWKRLPDPPLSARDAANGAWTGREVVVFGGVEVPSCPNCSSGTAPVPLRDGAAYDPAARRWRRIADVPLRLGFVQTAVAGGQVYVLSPEKPRAFIAYSPRDDRWRRHRPPALPGSDYGLTTIDGRLALLSDRRIAVYDPRARRWSKLPPVDAWQLLWTGEDLVALACTERPQEEGACLVRGAVLEGERWIPLPPSKINWLPGSWVTVDGRILCPCLGDSNSQRQWEAERTYPNGGILDMKARRWSPLPDPPGGADIWAGVLTARSLVHGRPDRLVLDLDRGEWMRIPEHPASDADGQTLVDAGRSLFTFGGTRNFKLRRDAWMWTPPPR